MTAEFPSHVPPYPIRRRQKRCTYGTARTKVLDLLERIGPCTRADLTLHLRNVVKPTTIVAVLQECRAQGVVLMPAHGVYALQQHLDGLSDLQLLRIEAPHQLEALVALAAKGRPWPPAILAEELAATVGKAEKLKPSTYLKAIHECWRAGRMVRVPGRGAELLVQSDVNEALHAEGFMPKKRKTPRALTAVEERLGALELDDLLS